MVPSSAPRRSATKAYPESQLKNIPIIKSILYLSMCPTLKAAVGHIGEHTMKKKCRTFLQILEVMRDQELKARLGSNIMALSCIHRELKEIGTTTSHSNVVYHLKRMEEDGVYGVSHLGECYECWKHDPEQDKHLG